jgi:hypothetical protein
MLPTLGCKHCLLVVVLVVAMVKKGMLSMYTLEFSVLSSLVLATALIWMMLWLYFSKG